MGTHLYTQFSMSFYQMNFIKGLFAYIALIIYLILKHFFLL